MPIKKKEVMWEELEKFRMGTLTLGPHTHPRSEISDFWDAAFWASIPDKPSTFPPSSHTHDDRYYTETELNDGQLDARYYTQSQIDTKLALQDTLADMGDVKILSPADGEILMWDAEANGGKWINSPGITDHGALSGLGDDDHTQYHTDARGDARYFRQVEFLATTAGVTDAGKPIKLNAAGLVDNTMMVACDADKVDGYHASAFSLTGHTHDSRYYTESEVDTKLALQDTLADMGDVKILSVQDNEILMYDAEANGGKWINVSGYPHSHDDLYYTEAELDAGQLDNQYYTKTELNAGQLDTRYYIETEINAFFEGYDAGKAQVHWDRVTNKPSTYPPSSHNHNDLYYTESEINTKLALQDTLAEMGDTHIVSPQDGEMLIWDDETEGGKWIASSEIASHNHDDRYYTETELNNGQLDNIYFGEDEFLVTSAGPGDSGKPIKLNAAGLVDPSMLLNEGKDELVKVGAAGGADYLNPNYFQRDVVDHVRIKLNTLLTGVDADKVDGLHAASFALTTRALDTFGATTDITTLNATTVKHGLLMKLGGGTANFLRADGTWAAPPGGVTDHGALSGLEDDDHSQYLLASGARALSADWDAGYYQIRSLKFQSDVSTGTAPFLISSTTKVINLNVDRVDGEHASAIVTKTRIDAQAADHGALSGRGDDDHSQYYNATRHTVAVHNALSIDHGSLSGRTHDDHSQYLLASGARALTANWDAGGYQIRSLKFLSDVSTGTIPLAVSSTTKCTNLNADLLDGYHASQAAGNNTVVVRNASGYIYCNWLNTLSGETSNNPTHYFVESGNDSFIRQMTPAIFISNLRADGLMGVVGGTFTGAIYAPDHVGTPAHAQVTNCCYGTGAPPAANTTTIGTLFIRYTA